jgi:hypothetical protein
MKQKTLFEIPPYYIERRGILCVRLAFSPEATNSCTVYIAHIMMMIKIDQMRKACHKLNRRMQKYLPATAKQHPMTPMNTS